MQILTKTLSNKKIKVAESITDFKEYKAIKKIILSGNYVSGSNVKLFEEKFSKKFNHKNSVALNSGTAALHCALISLGIKKKDEVIVPSISFASTATSVLHNGSKPVFCDVEFGSYCLDPEDLKKKINSKTKAVILTHFTGNCCDMDKILKILKNKKIFLIEDCAQAHGSKYKQKYVGNFGDAACYSFYATKHLTTGEGGMVVFKKKRYADIAKKIRNHGLVDRNNHELIGYNYRMNELEAKIGIIQLSKFEKFKRKRIFNSKYLIKKISKNKKLQWLTPQIINKNVVHTFFWCPFFINNKKIKLKSLKNYLLKKGIEIRERYDFPLYKQKIFKKYNKKILKNAELLAGNIFGLPNHHLLKKKELNYIVSSLEDYTKK
ncbi:DegT/DnrJ/EryC1/StrS family aminotransferase [Candidatus Pelagibacter sp.]|nr:DegT/DnrJ/EryC1/StrS family aminotransferase [Candidatus Pelagibacter sp.]